MQDDVKQLLDQMEIPEPSTGAAQRVVSQARHMQQRGSLWLRLRQWKAWLFQRQVRYMVMACVVVSFALIGMFGQADSPTNPTLNQPNSQSAAMQPDPLDDIDFGIDDWYEEADWLG